MPQLLPENLVLGPVTLAVRDLGRAQAFYAGTLGLEPLSAEDGAVRLGAGGRTLIVLLSRPAGKRDRDEAGLFHTALRVPERADLGAVLRRLAERDARLTGAADHLVSEAVYLDDPEGNGVELYVDRPSTTWFENGRMRLSNDPLDLDGLLKLAPAAGPLPATTVVGHVHLETHALAAARQFYVERLGMEVMTAWPQAVFLARGGYHHHLALNSWAGRTRPAGALETRLGLIDYAMVVGPDALAQAAGVLTEARSDRDGLTLTDPSGLDLRLMATQP